MFLLRPGVIKQHIPNPCPLFQTDPKSVCYRVSADTKAQYDVTAIPEMRDVMRENFANTQALKWQNFGTEEGIMLKYPAHVSPQCDNYDPRFRSVYSNLFYLFTYLFIYLHKDSRS